LSSIEANPEYHELTEEGIDSTSALQDVAASIPSSTLSSSSTTSVVSEASEGTGSSTLAFELELDSELEKDYPSLATEVIPKSTE
jgi:hypothetical protein